MFKSTGVIRYSPKTLGKYESQKWWLIIDCDKELGRYYRHLYHLFRYRCHELMRPAWAEHITVIRNEEPPDEYKPLWEVYAGQEVDFFVDFQAQTDGNYVWLPVQCTLALDIRTKLGLRREPELPLHLSIGHGGSS